MHHESEPAAVLQRAAEAVGAPVGDRREELSDQVTACQRLDAVEAALLAAQGGSGIGLDHAIDVVLVHLLGDTAMQRLADRRRRDRRQPVSGIGVSAPAEMRDLAHEAGAERVHAGAEPLQVRNDVVAADVELAEDVRRIAVHVGGAAEHRQGDAAARLLLVIALIGLLRHAIDLEPAGMAGAHDAVAEPHMLDRQRLQQRVFGYDRGIRFCTSYCSPCQRLRATRTLRIAGSVCLACRASPARRPDHRTWLRNCRVRGSLALVKNCAGGPCSTITPPSVK